MTQPTRKPRTTVAVLELPRKKDTHVTPEESPVGPGIDAQVPDSMPRAEDDEATRAQSLAFRDRPGSGKLIADRQRYF